MERGQARGAAEDLKLSRGAGGGLETVRKDLGATERLVDGGTVEVRGAAEDLKVSRGAGGGLETVNFAATQRLVDGSFFLLELLRGTGWRRCGGFGAGAGSRDAVTARKATESGKGHWTLQGKVPSSWIE